MTLRLFIKIEPHNRIYRVCWYADRKGIDNFNVKVIERFCYIILHNNDAGSLLCINIISKSCMTLYSLANML